MNMFLILVPNPNEIFICEIFSTLANAMYDLKYDCDFTYQEIPQKQPSQSDKARTLTLCDYNMEDEYDEYDDIFNSS